jgi:hypothetical protein
MLMRSVAAVQQINLKDGLLFAPFQFGIARYAIEVGTLLVDERQAAQYSRDRRIDAVER